MILGDLPGLSGEPSSGYPTLPVQMDGEQGQKFEKLLAENTCNEFPGAPCPECLCGWLGGHSSSFLLSTSTAFPFIKQLEQKKQFKSFQF